MLIRRRKRKNHTAANDTDISHGKPELDGAPVASPIADIPELENRRAAVLELDSRNTETAELPITVPRNSVGATPRSSTFDSPLEIRELAVN